MKRSTLLLLVGVVLLSFGYTKNWSEDKISKIYLIDNMLIRTTPGENIRFYDISNPASVNEIGKIAIDQNSEVAVKGNYMYADRAYDLFVYDISNPASPNLVDSVRKVFQYINVYEGGVVVEDDWGGEDRTDDVGGLSGCRACQDQTSEPPMVDPSSGGVRTASSSEGSATDNATGQGGSLARFMIVGNYLYCIDQDQVKVFDISDPAHPRYRNMVQVQWGIETLFNEGNHLFIGGQAGMYIYSLDNPEDPEKVSEFNHANSCDPVVVDGDRAYVTLRGGSPCGGYTNQLDIIDISTIENPQLLKSVPLEGPYGLAARDGLVLVCDGQGGLKTMKTEDLNDISVCNTITGFTTYDVIWYNDLVILNTDDGFWLYDGHDPCNLTKHGKLF